MSRFHAIDDARLNRLPGWASDAIRGLREENIALRDSQQREARTNVYVSRFEGGAHVVTHLAEDATYTFRVAEKPDTEIRVRMIERYGTRVLDVNCDGRVVTHHGSSNAFTVEVVR